MRSSSGIICSEPFDHSTLNLLLVLNLLLIAIGGAIGSVARYSVSLAATRLVDVTYPVGTMAVNVLGCFVFGAIAGVGEHRLPLSSPARALLLVGVLGGFTTFSTYAFESIVLVRDGRADLAVLNVAGQTLIGLAAIWAGLYLTR